MSPEAVLAPPVAAPPVSKPALSWLVGPWFDLFFVANLAWPCVFLISLAWERVTHEPLSFVQIYFLSTPHRWITLVLVFLDPVNFPANPKKYGLIGAGLIAGGIALIIAGTLHPYGQATLYMLMMVDYVWNTWHFAAQHAGISRIYARLGQRQQSDREIEFEKSAIRCLVIWTLLRAALYVAILPGRQLEAYADYVRWLFPLDYVFLAQALVLVAREFGPSWRTNKGRIVYLLSVISVYAVQMIAMQTRNDSMIKSAILVGAVFHAVEYLAIVSWSVSKKKGGVWSYLAPRTALFVLVFMAALGTTNYLLARQSIYAWTVVTLLVSLLHYGYDGIIWKSRPKSPTAPAPAPAAA